jgi:hypothetical protein
MTPQEVRAALPKFVRGVSVKVQHHKTDFRIIQILIVHSKPKDKTKARFNYEFTFDPGKDHKQILEKLAHDVKTQLKPFGFIDDV